MTAQSEDPSPAISWDDLPPQTWPEHTVAPVDELADWLTSLSREHLMWVLARQQVVWSQESDCFMRDHRGQIRRLEERLLNIQTSLQLLGIEVDSRTPPKSEVSSA